MENPIQPVNRSNNKQKLLRIFLITLGAITLLGLGAGGVYWGVKQKPEVFGIESESNEKTSLEEINNLVSEVGKLIDLPIGENPTVATVTDTEKVKSQPFFAKAKVGDKVLVYSNSKKAYLYRPSDKKVIEVGFVNLGQPTGQAAGTASQNTESVSPTVVPTKTSESTPAITNMSPTVSTVPPSQPTQ